MHYAKNKREMTQSKHITLRLLSPINVFLVGNVFFVKLFVECVTRITLPYGKLRCITTYE